METWGELFWDAWIRLRLAFRRLYRTYWPPRFKAWQVCTFTGIVSIILTLVVLNLPGDKTALQSKNENPPKAGKKPGKSSLPAKLVAAADDPFAGSDSGPSSLVDDTVPPNQTEAMESEEEPPVAKRRRPTEVAVNDLPATDSAFDQRPFSDASEAEQPTLPPAVDENTEPALPPETTESSAVVEKPATERDVVPFAPTESATAVDVEQPATEPAAEAGDGELAPSKNQVPVRQHTPFKTPIRPNSHYSRLGTHEDSEEDRHSVRNIRPTRSNVVLIPGGKPAPKAAQDEPAAPAESESPAATPALELPPIPAEAPGATEKSAPPTAEDKAATESEPSPFTPTLAEPPSSPAQAPVESNSEEAVDAGPQPPVLVAPELETTEAVQPSRVESHGPVKSTGPTDHEAHQAEDAFHRPVRKNLPTILPPRSNSGLPPVTGGHKSVDHEAHQAEDAFDRPVRKKVPAVESPAETDMPPVVEEPATISEILPTTDGDKPADHEAHQAEDAFDRPVRRKDLPAPSSTPPVIEDPAAKSALPPVTEGHKPVDHEGHQAEDAFDRPVRKKVPAIELPLTKEDSPAVEDQPAPSETRKPIEEDAAAPTTAPRSSSKVILGGVAPRIIEEGPEPDLSPETTNSSADEDKVIPMAVPGTTQPRGPERITVPERMPPIEDDPVRPAGPQDTGLPEESEFTVAPRPGPQAEGPRVTMEITGPKQIPVGTQVVLHFKLQNVGDAPVTGIVVSDILPSGLQHRLSPDLEFRVARLNPGETRETNLTVQCVARGIITNKAVLKAEGDVTVQSEIQIEVTDAAAGTATPPRSSQSPFTFRHHGPERWLVDSTGQFLMTVTNNSSQSLRNVTITQTYPEGTNLVHATLGHKVDAKSRTVSWTIAEFGPGISYVLETELHSLSRGPGTSIARIKIGDAEVAEDRWTAVSYVTMRP